MQILFLWDSLGQQDASAAQQVAADNCDDAALRLRALEMASATWAHRDVSDRWVLRLAPHWPIHRQPIVDRNLLRLAIWELTSTNTPPKVAIDEAIELAKQFSTEQSAAFVNGVLDAVLKEKVASCEL